MLYNILVHAHSGLRWLLLILLLAAIAVAFSKWRSRDEYAASDNKLYVFAMVLTHIQLLIGLILYFLSPKVDFGMMSEKIYRFYTAEHTVGMLIAIALITVGRVRSRKAANAVDKHRHVFVFYGLGLLVILLSIPWPFRIPGAGWF
ncbi:cytochrome B [Nibrella viscosa]|uniref:Cytochrome B n=1 Tax=Nibrella viscosa TaxID=1084524 RepID=A0ABP8KGV6_9BACT